MTPEEWLRLLETHRAIAVVRSHDATIALKMAQAVIEAGMGLIEITWNSGNAANLIRTLVEDYPDCIIGTGTILTPADLQAAIDAGAKFAFSPHTSEVLIRLSYAQQVPMVPGALSPTEIVTAWQAGAACVKVFPIKTMGGTSYLNCLRGPLGHIPLIPTGGITTHNALEFLKAGAIAVGLSSHLFPKPLLDKENWALITERASVLRSQISASKVAST
ncbi:MAG: bifunctional 4-hydroxy-2-oxoglutarate aldolase/2-dehydro-3-deoxy-phosphogluconate aldolase [Cyanobacteria bacterium P01_F01_bin.150]